MKLRRWAGLVLYCLLGACASKPPPPPAAPPPPPIALIDPTTACLQGLDQRHVQFERSADFHTPEGCGIDGAVKFKAAGAPLNRPLLLACPTAVSLADFETLVWRRRPRRPWDI